MKTLKIKIIGTVQGVFFRMFVKESADKLDIKGFVRNMDDGSVEIVAEGKENNINEFLDICKKGPSQASIKNVNIEEIKHQGFDSFKILSL